MSVSTRSVPPFHQICISIFQLRSRIVLPNLQLLIFFLCLPILLWSSYQSTLMYFVFICEPLPFHDRSMLILTLLYTKCVPSFSKAWPTFFAHLDTIIFIINADMSKLRSDGAASIEVSEFECSILYNHWYASIMKFTFLESLCL